MALAQTFTVAQFQQKWRGVTLNERSASQCHFNDLCHVVGVPAPTDGDPTGDFYTFERDEERPDGGEHPLGDGGLLHTIKSP